MKQKDEIYVSKWTQYIYERTNMWWGWYTRLRWWWCVHSVPHIMPISLCWQKWALFMSYQAISSESTIHMNIQFGAVIFAHSSFAWNARYSSTINHLYSRARAPLNIRLVETWLRRLRCDAGKYSEFWRWARNDEKCCGLAAVVMCWVELMRLARGSGRGRGRGGTFFWYGIGKGKKWKYIPFQRDNTAIKETLIK